MIELTERLADALTVCDSATEGPWESGQAARGNPADGPDHVEIESRRGVVADLDLAPQAAVDAQFISEARTGYPAALRALQAVLELHRPERRWQLDIDAEVSYETFGEAQDAGDGSESGVTYFEVCEECKRVEESHDDTHTTEGGYLMSLWPCATFQAITEHLDGDDE